MPETIKQAYAGLNLSSILQQVKDGQLTYAMNALIAGFDGNSITYQNEEGNEFCVALPEGFRLIGHGSIIEKDYVIVMLANPLTNASEIGKILVNSCEYEKIINASCLKFHIDFPIHKIFYRITNCSTEIYWTDGNERMRWMDLDNLPYKTITQGCDEIVTTEIDCNKMNVQPNFSIPTISPTLVDSGGTLKAGTAQFGIQYAASNSDGYTAVYSITNPLPLSSPNLVTPDFNYVAGKSISLLITNLDTTGFFKYFNLISINTVNEIPTAEIVGTYQIDRSTKTIVYTGQHILPFTIEEVFLKNPLYDKADDVFTVGDRIGWKGLTTAERISYQSIANQIHLQWMTYRLNGNKPYSKELNAVNLRSTMRDEVYPYEICFLLSNGKQTDGFHIPARAFISSDITSVLNADVTECDESTSQIGLTTTTSTTTSPTTTTTTTTAAPTTTTTTTTASPLDAIIEIPSPALPEIPCGECIPVAQPKWKVYNTAIKGGMLGEYTDCYEGPWEYGEFAYWESTELYPCNDIWGELKNTPIRHHKFPDSLITHIHDNEGYIYPIGVRIDVQQIVNLIRDSSLSIEEKKAIQGFKILRGNRINNKSVIAKGLINNVGAYEKDGSSYFFPNYPYNDLRPDPFIDGGNSYVNSSTGGTFVPTNCNTYTVYATSSGSTLDYTDCNNVDQTITMAANEVLTDVCAILIKESSTISFSITTGFCGGDDGNGTINIIDPNVSSLQAFASSASLYRNTFHSPDTHFFQPSLSGNEILKLETVEYGTADSHFVEVRNHARYSFLSDGAVIFAIGIAIGVGFASLTIGTSNNLFNGTAAYTALNVMLDIMQKTLPKKNFAYEYTSVGNYNKYQAIDNIGNKQRLLNIASYASPGIINVGDTLSLNNFQRESSVYLRTTQPIIFPSDQPGVAVEDNTRYKQSSSFHGGCDVSEGKISHPDIVSYYAAIKRNIPNQYGQMYSYETIDTGYQKLIDVYSTTPYEKEYLFGGDIFINKFSYKTKFPFFTDNRVNAPDFSDIAYNRIGNVAYPNSWFSTDLNQGNFFGMFGVRETKFDCDDHSFFYDSGKIYLFAYGIPTFFCESEVNVDLRQAYNSTEGDFYPRVSNGIPDVWLQETTTSINYDNTYTYNKTYSKQNKENYFSHLPEDYSPQECRTVFPFRAIYSEQRSDGPEFGERNNWLIYKPSSYFDFPQNHGFLISLDGIENSAVLARFENKSLLYNVLLTAPTSAQQVYLGQTIFSHDTPPLDFAETDLGFVGTQNKFLLKTEYGRITTDTKRGQIFLLNGQQAKEITNENVNAFFTEFFTFQINKKFPSFPVDNAFNGCGITGTYDTKYNRFILTKIDYKPLLSTITYSNGVFKYNNEIIELSNKTYFENYSFTISYNFDIQSFVSFHSYIPNYYIGLPNYFYTGMDTYLWRHNTSISTFNNFYGDIHPYTIEYPFSYKQNDEIIQSVKDYSKAYQYTDFREWVETDDVYFNKAILYSGKQCSGILTLAKKPINNLAAYNSSPTYNIDSKTILYTKSDSFYNYNTFWSMVKDTKKPIWIKSIQNLSFYKELNQLNMDYSKRSFKKEPIRSKELKIRHTLDNRSDTKLLSNFIITRTQTSFK